MNAVRLGSAAVALLLAAGVAWGQDEDDDPKFSTKRAPAVAPAPAKPFVKSEKPRKEEPLKRAGRRTVPTPPPPPPAPVARPNGAAEDRSLRLVTLEETFGPSRTVRVRFLDGSSVVGQVQSERSETLVIDCAMGQLAIPRTRIASVVYDVAAGLGQKRAPVQMLDDEPPKKK